MSPPIIRECDHYLVMEPSRDEKFLSKEETLKWLETWIKKMNKLPKDLENQASNQSAAKRLLDISCNLEIKPGFTIQWFAVRINQTD